MTIPRIKKGEPITAPWLGLHTDAINRMTGLGGDGAPGSGLRVGKIRKAEYIGAITARTVPAGDPPYEFNAIEYEATCPELSPNPIVITWDKRVVRAVRSLIEPSADPALPFHPAPIIGSAEQIADPWRGYCRITVLHGVGDQAAAPVWWAEVFGESPAYQCEVTE